MHTMRRLQIYIEEQLDDALGMRATREGTSKAALIREYVAERLELDSAPDPLDRLVGSVDVEPAPIDEVVYGT
jgi:hypothetical protein